MTEALRDNPDIVGVRRAYEVNTPGYDIDVNRAMAREIGVDARAISDAVRTFFASAEVTEFISQRPPVSGDPAGPGRPPCRGR